MNGSRSPRMILPKERGLKTVFRISIAVTRVGQTVNNVLGEERRIAIFVERISKVRHMD